ncbi:hypothetical protein Tdes44962_MAKER04771 [Teratosphaeria destructans]|uniref:PBP domain-containing protein n=1 Tax=Teratosphaeria destructans TaxID=418781 RepID=A0A9W7SLI1_9PEZI|nr:hypothetical protein Tdes44962_MAKER04771 [Teratosphaeria destructans]
MPDRSTTIISHGIIDSRPREVYGNGPTELRIGNGGAGLLKALSEDYLSRRSGAARSISWVCNHSRNTQLALLHDYVDVALTYERDQENVAEGEGWAVNHGCVFHDHFCLAGPVADPAGIATSSVVGRALQMIAEKQMLFHGRADFSATMWKERSLWEVMGLRPFEEDNGKQDWYRTTQYTPAQAIIEADKAGAYLLIDRSTLLRQVADGKVHNTTVFLEPSRRDDVLMNSCYALTRPDPPEATVRFLEYLTSVRGQDIIARFGVEETGMPSFASIENGFAEKGLRGGWPAAGRWIARQKISAVL